MVNTAVKNKKVAIVTLHWIDNSANETGFLIQRADNAAFSVGVVNAAVGANVTTFYYRLVAFNDTRQSAWSNTATVTTP